MTERDFVYWLTGYLEVLSKNDGLTKEQMDLILTKLNSLNNSTITLIPAGGHSGVGDGSGTWTLGFFTPSTY